MRVVCAWCQRVLSGGDDDAPVSHGICANCRADVEFERLPLDELVARLPSPVLAVDGEGRVLAANGVASAVLGAAPAAMRGELCGDVIQCVHARLTGGCGKTEHCVGCAIRRAIEHTAKTGEPVRDVPALNYVRGADAPIWRAYRVSTERIGRIVLLCIEPDDREIAASA